MLKKFALFLIKKCLFNMFFFAGAHQTKYVCFCVHLSFYTQIYSSTILLSSFCPAVTEARNEFTKVAFDLRAPLRLVSLGQRGEAWHTRVHSTVAPAAAAAFVASLISIWRMQVYCVLWGTIIQERRDHLSGSVAAAALGSFVGKMWSKLNAERQRPKASFSALKPN